MHLQRLEPRKHKEIDFRGAIAVGVMHELGATQRTLAEHVFDQVYQLTGRERLEPKQNASTFVLALGFCQAAQNQDGQPGQALSYLFHQFRAVHTRHEVIGHHKSDGVADRIVAEQEQSFSRAACDQDADIGSAQDGTARFSLDRVVVDEQDQSVHGFRGRIDSGYWEGCELLRAGCTS